MVVSELKIARIRAGLTQVQLAAKLGTDQAMVSNWENGKQTPSRKYAQLLSDLLDVPVSTLRDSATRGIESESRSHD